MKCTNNEPYRRKSRSRRMRQIRRRRRQRRIAAILIMFVLIIGAGTTGIVLLLNQSGTSVVDYETEKYNTSLYKGNFFADDLCVSAEDVSLEGYQDANVHAAGLFDLNNKAVLYGYRLFDKIYPASTTKVMTAYLALKYGNMEDVVTVSENATDFPWDASICGLKPGDQVTMYDLVCGLMLHSGNDCATAIAEHISGSEEAFVELMNEEAEKLGATGTHFMNPHGLPDNDHYTTAYDLYLMFYAAASDERFVDIISMKTYTGSLTGADGTVRTEQWDASNYYSAGKTEAPSGFTMIGGKTGTTDLAGNCVIMYGQNSKGDPYISVVMGAESKDALYQEMNSLLSAAVTG